MKKKENYSTMIFKMKISAQLKYTWRWCIFKLQVKPYAHFLFRIFNSTFSFYIKKKCHLLQLFTIYIRWKILKWLEPFRQTLSIYRNGAFCSSFPLNTMTLQPKQINLICPHPLIVLPSTPVSTHSKQWKQQTRNGQSKFVKQ